MLLQGLVDDASVPLWGGYLANVSATEFLGGPLQTGLPETIRGREFKDQYGTHFDTVTGIEDERT